MNDKTNAADVGLDLSQFSDETLEALIPRIEEELATRQEKRREEAFAKVRTIAEEVGLTPEELLGVVGRGQRKRSRRGNIVWQHPDNQSLIYRGGKKPDWLKKLMEEGREPNKLER